MTSALIFVRLAADTSSAGRLPSGTAPLEGRDGGLRAGRKLLTEAASFAFVNCGSKVFSPFVEPPQHASTVPFYDGPARLKPVSPWIVVPP